MPKLGNDGGMKLCASGNIFSLSEGVGGGASDALRPFYVCQALFRAAVFELKTR